MKILLEIAYLGTHYHGWQVQNNNSQTIQGILQNAIKQRCEFPFTLTGCSRTDAGVHANSFFCTVQVDGDWRIPCASIPFALNCILPDDISVKNASICSDDFHPRYSCKGKEYKYILYNTPHKDPFFADRGWHVPQHLDFDVMQKAAGRIVGTHDFSSFCASGSGVDDKTRTVYSCNVEKDGNVISVTVSGNGFLYNMVRIIVGTLVYVGMGKIDEKSISNIIDAKDRTLAGITAPPGGLYLNRVFY